MDPTWHEELELPDGLYSVSDIQDYPKYIFKRHETALYNPSIRIYINEIENRITLSWPFNTWDNEITWKH